MQGSTHNRTKSGEQVRIIQNLAMQCMKVATKYKHFYL